MSLDITATYRRQGLATAMYVYAERETGYTVIPSTEQTPEGKKLWSQPDRPFGKEAAMYGKFTGEQVVDYVQKQNKIDRQSAHQLVGLDSGGDYKLRDFPLAKLVAGDDYSPGRAQEYADQEGEFPPIVLGLDSRISRTGWTMVPFYTIRDGNHRVAAAKLRGDKTIKAYVPIDSTK
jgi:hypothetical protein